ncbi:hypothetical protein PCH70_27320 [Pseudomonas cichorii JBC1]|nr:hypothetical protein PCH70_27320 [Pseudomonas cichorii JBC1]
MPPKFQLSDAIEGTKVPIKDKIGLLKCEPLKQETSTAARETFCKVTLNDQVLVSAQIIFEPLSESRMDEQPANPLTRPISSLIETLQRP